MYVCKTLFKHGKSSVELSFTSYMTAVWESDMLDIFLRFRLN